MIVIHDDRGTTYGPRAYMNIVDSRHRLSTRHDRYFTGKEKPNYPVPATMALADTMMLADRWAFHSVAIRVAKVFKGKPLRVYGP